MANNEAIRKVLNSGSGKALREYLIFKANQLRDIDNLKEKNDPSEQAIELKASKRAYTKLIEILAEMMDLTTEERERDPRDSFHVE